MWDTVAVSVSNGMAYVMNDGLRVFDVTNPGSPALRGSWPCSNWEDGGMTETGLYATGGLVYLADPMGLTILQYTGPYASAHRWEMYC